MLLTNDMHVTIDPQPVQPVNHCFTTCTGRTSRTSRVKPFTGRIRLTVLDKDDWKAGIALLKCSLGEKSEPMFPDQLKPSGPGLQEVHEYEQESKTAKQNLTM